ncbi:hypothetical protein QZH41_009173 [Actinostola sp. cb2023]|nr:hypothetical protein QZH41_009173 [Actinostola sp. cb2023]
MSNAVEFNSLTANDEVKVKMEPQSRMTAKPSDEEVAKYSKTRVILVIMFGILIITMVVAAVVIIIVSPKCPVKKPPIDREWFKGDIVYQINARSLKDTNGDGTGDIKGITESLDYFKGLGVKILRLSSIYPSPNQDNDIEDFQAIDKVMGNMSDFEELIKKAHEKDLNIVLDFVPNHSSEKHKWFVDSAKKIDSDKRGWYVWQKKSNNWPSVSGGSAWEKDSTTNELYLHQFEKYKPDLNLRNDSVVEELNKVLKFWMEKGVDGFNAIDVQFLLENNTFTDETPTGSYNGSDLKYESTDHSKTFGLSGNVDLVKKFRDTLNEASSHKLLMLDLRGTPDQIEKFAEQSDVPSFTGLLNIKTGDNIPAAVNKTVSEYLNSLKKDQWPNFAISNDKSSVSDRLGSSLVNAMNVLLLTLPGNPSTSFGEELGVSAKMLVDWKKVEEQKKQKDSKYNVYKAAAKLREEDAFKAIDFKVVHVGAQVLGYVRGNKYLVAINFDTKRAEQDNLNGISGRGKVVLDSEFKLNDEKKDVNQVQLNAGQAVVILLDSGFQYL